MPLKTVARGTGGGGGGSGTVTSVNVSGGTTGLTTTGGPITTAGEITIGGALNIANGGTGQTSKTAAFDALAPTTTKGDLVVYDGTDNIRLAVGTNGYYLKADSTTGSGLAWDSVAAGGVTSVTATAPLASSGGATPDISLTGIVPIANGGTGETTDVAAFDALAPTTTKGDIIVYDGSDNIRLGVGAHSYVLTADSTTASGLTWASVGGGGSGTTTYAVTFNNGGTGDASGTTFDGSVARTISYNTFGAANSGANTNITSLDSITALITFSLIRRRLLQALLASSGMTMVMERLLRNSKVATLTYRLVKKTLFLRTTIAARPSIKARLLQLMALKASDLRLYLQTLIQSH
jgi:hypothetical protein